MKDALKHGIMIFPANQRCRSAPRQRRRPNIGLTFKSVPERSEGLAWFVHESFAQTCQRIYKVEAVVGQLIIQFFSYFS